jgi:hypothetical protein
MLNQLFVWTFKWPAAMHCSGHLYLCYNTLSTHRLLGNQRVETQNKAHIYTLILSFHSDSIQWSLLRGSAIWMWSWCLTFQGLSLSPPSEVDMTDVVFTCCICIKRSVVCLSPDLSCREQWAGSGSQCCPVPACTIWVWVLIITHCKSMLFSQHSYHGLASYLARKI